MKCGMSINLSIADIHLEISLDRPVKITDNFKPFLDAASEPDYKVECTKMDVLPSVRGEMMENESD